MVVNDIRMSRAKRLKRATNETHDRLDHSIMATNPFASRQRYSLFLMVQYQFHQEIDVLFRSAIVERVLPDIGRRRRLHLIGQDLADLGIVPALTKSSHAFDDVDNVDLAASLGWLYVAEGSNLGAAFLLKEALKLNVSEEFGARHLAAAPEGRGLHWRTFTSALDAVKLTDVEEARVVDGARAAFACVRKSVDEFLSDPDVDFRHVTDMASTSERSEDLS